MADRFDPDGVSATMMAVVTAGQGGFDQLLYRCVRRPLPKNGEVLVHVLAAGVNNTDINTRVGWYASTVTASTAESLQPAGEGSAEAGGWQGATPFPMIQGTDCAGRIAGFGAGVDPGLLGRRVLVRPCMRINGFHDPATRWLAADFDGAFAQFVTVPASEVFVVECDWTDAELASIPCAYGTSENMLHRARVGAGELVLVTGASGGVGSATVQLARRRGARVIAVAARGKHDDLRSIGADRLLDRDADPAEVLGTESVDVVIDNVAGQGFPRLLKALRRGGRYVSSGAIAGPIVSLDMRDLYLKDLTLIGTTAWDEPVFPNLIGYIERNEIRPLVAATYPLCDIAKAQKDFLEKRHVGKLVLIPPSAGQA
ncbi:alcohol dehydrogenase family protein [Frigidibacter sp. RF13]|uniref:alcohol dehydrogenase family protein n=1 Tax=Frigidibacter sp. RF13 TaxID=2997340 RepID=UPI00226F7EFB|nr:alcohol dehydrogenase family protein [Frigidibacter sp. RF13]MCY1127674.1 alcohol dehydrogenase family protein [Frigidibacter sp. RF13]